MNLTSGIFTAPRPGIYFFSFTGLADFPISSSKVYLHVSLFLNWDPIGSGYVSESNTVEYQKSPLTLQSTLNLKKGDQVWVEIYDKGIQTWAFLFDYNNSFDNNSFDHFTHFTGWMLEEEIAASLQ